MTSFRLLVTHEGKHPASKWADLAADDIIEIGSKSPQALIKDAQEFRVKLVQMLTVHHQHMMDHEQQQIKAGHHDIDADYDTEDHADKVVDEICALAAATSFREHFAQDHVREHLTAVCNRSFKSAKLVERHHHHAEAAKSRADVGKKK